LSAHETQQFLEASAKLASIENVQKFEILRQTSPKNKFEYGISMKFDNQDQYYYFSNHPEHLAFIQNFWLTNVEDFLEIHYLPI
jgi:Stress responsive A/B Barrel Domain